jgi:hypothetical protein
VATPSTPLVITYIDPDGNSWNLSDLTMSNGYVCTGIAGIQGIPVMIQTTPFLDGTAFANLYIPQPGSISLGMLVGRPASGAENDYYALLDSVTRAFLSRRNEVPAPGYLQIQRPDGTTRQVTVYTTAGLDTPETDIDYTVFAFTLQTPDPYWYDLVQQNLVFTISDAPGILPLLPIQLAASTIIGNATITNNGSALAYPVWTITGPGTPTIQNLTTGRQWSLNTPIPAGQVIQVATQPGQQYAANITTATNIWDELVLSSLRDLWPLVGGVNQVSLSMPGSSTSTAISVSWTQRWSRA